MYKEGESRAVQLLFNGDDQISGLQISISPSHTFSPYLVSPLGKYPFTLLLSCYIYIPIFLFLRKSLLHAFFSSPSLLYLNFFFISIPITLSCFSYIFVFTLITCVHMCAQHIFLLFRLFSYSH